MDFPTSDQSRDIEVSLSLPDPDRHESSYNVHTQWEPGEKPLQPHSSERKAQVSSLPKQRGVTEFPQENWVYPNHE